MKETRERERESDSIQSQHSIHKVTHSHTAKINLMNERVRITMMSRHRPIESKLLNTNTNQKKKK